MSECCHKDGPENGHEKAHKKKFDYILNGSLSIIISSIVLYYAGIESLYLENFAHTVMELLGTIWWGVILGLIFVGLMNKLPREYFTALLGRGDSFGGIIRAAIAGLFLDLCSHGILMIGAKLYERGASLSQVMTFLIASPWNSLSLTIILFTLIGPKWTLLFIAGSALIAVITGLIYNLIVKHGILPPNPNTTKLPKDFSIKKDVKARLKNFKFTFSFVKEVVAGGANEARMLLRWLLMGVVLASAIRTFVQTDTFTQWFGPTLFGLAMTMIFTTILEVCSEGSAPIAAEIFNRAKAPGNAFAFLMAGVSTDYTEMMILRDTTKSWLIALSLPITTLPQVLLLSYIMNINGI